MTRDEYDLKPLEGGKVIYVDEYNNVYVQTGLQGTNALRIYRLQGGEQGHMFATEVDHTLRNKHADGCLSWATGDECECRKLLDSLRARP